jgi:hypothetical protein
VNGSGVVNGTIGGTAQTYSNVTATVTDAGGVSVTSAVFTWVVYGPPSLGGVTAKSIGETATPSIPVTYSCPATPCIITLTGTLATTPIGLGLSTTPVNATTNATRSLTVASTSGTVYVNGLVSTTAVTTGTSKAYGVTLDITDANGSSPADSTTTYTAYSTPTISTPGPNTTSQSGTPSRTLTYYCPGSCTVAVSGLPSGLGLSTGANTSANSTMSRTVTSSSGNLYLNGRVSSTAPRTTYLVTVTITYGSTVVTSSGIWTVS